MLRFSLKILLYFSSCFLAASHPRLGPGVHLENGIGHAGSSRDRVDLVSHASAVRGGGRRVDSMIAFCE